MKRILISLLLCPLLINAGPCGSKCISSQELNAVAPSGPANDAKSSGNFFMPSNPDNERVVDLKLTMQIVTDDEDIHDLLSVDDKRLIASYCALFKQCKNDVSNLAPETASTTKNLNKNGYLFTSVIQSVDFQKYTGNSVHVAYTIEKNGQKRQDDVTLTFDLNAPMHGKDPINKKQFLLLLLSEIEKK